MKIVIKSNTCTTLTAKSKETGRVARINRTDRNVIRYPNKPGPSIVPEIKK